MGERGGTDEIGRVVDEHENGENVDERLFFPWERSLSFGKGALCVGIVQTPARLLLSRGWKEMGYMQLKWWVHQRGKFRLVGWKSLYKDESFNKNVARGDGARVRGCARLRERAREEAARGEVGRGIETDKTRVTKGGKDK
jgi:hypothetical protein